MTSPTSMGAMEARKLSACAGERESNTTRRSREVSAGKGGEVLQRLPSALPQLVVAGDEAALAQRDTPNHKRTDAAQAGQAMELLHILVLGEQEGVYLFQRGEGQVGERGLGDLQVADAAQVGEGAWRQ